MAIFNSFLYVYQRVISHSQPMSYPKMLPDPVMSPDDYLTSVASRNSYPTPKRKAKQFWKKPSHLHSYLNPSGGKTKTNYKKMMLNTYFVSITSIKSPKCLRLLVLSNPHGWCSKSPPRCSLSSPQTPSGHDSHALAPDIVVCASPTRELVPRELRREHFVKGKRAVVMGALHIHACMHAYITLHFITLHYITSHYNTIHTITYHYIPLHTITYHYIPLHTITYNYIPLHTITITYPLPTTTNHYVPLRTNTLHCIALHYITLHAYLRTYVHT